MSMHIEFSGLAPVGRDAFAVLGADGTSGRIYPVRRTVGDVRKVLIF